MIITLYCLVSYSESSVRLDSGVEAEAVGSVSLGELLMASTRTKGSGFELGRRRSKRSVFLHSGVKICPQESISEVVTSHQAYYQLRGTGLVCFTVIFILQTHGPTVHSYSQTESIVPTVSYPKSLLDFPALHGFSQVIFLVMIKVTQAKYHHQCAPLLSRCVKKANKIKQELCSFNLDLAPL